MTARHTPGTAPDAPAGPAPAGPGARAAGATQFDRQVGPGVFTPEQQRRLRGARVVVAGVGGLGGAVATYLAAAGVGALDLVHPGPLEVPDLNRQTLMTPDDLGAPRVHAAARTLRRHHPHVQVTSHDVPVDGPAVRALLAAADLVVDARHNFPERHRINRWCRELGVPTVVGAMDAAGLQVLACEVDGPCWRCVFPHADPAWEPLGFMVVGAVAGAAGCLTALEALRLLAGPGPDTVDPALAPGHGRLLFADLWSWTFRRVDVRRRADCPDCARAPARPAADAARTGAARAGTATRGGAGEAR